MLEWERTMTQLHRRTHRKAAAPARLEIIALEGIVDDISLRGGLHFYIRDPLTARRQRVIAPLERLSEVVATLGRRVSLTGTAAISQDGDVRSIALDQLDVLPRDEELPPLNELLEQMVKRDITGDVPADAWLRRLRDDG